MRDKRGLLYSESVLMYRERLSEIGNAWDKEVSRRHGIVDRGDVYTQPGKGERERDS